MPEAAVLSEFKRLIVGHPIPSDLAHHERLSRVTGLAVLSSDPLSSVAYATEEVLRVLIPRRIRGRRDLLEAPSERRFVRLGCQALATLERRGGSCAGSGRAVLERLFELLADRRADLAAAPRPDQLVDVGCGTGSTTVPLARRMGTTAPCVGVGISEPTLSAASGGRHRRRDGELHVRQRADLPVRAGELRPDPTRAAPGAFNVSAVFKLPGSSSSGTVQ